MQLVKKLKICIRAFKNIGSKRGLASKVIQIFKREGLTGIKYRIYGLANKASLPDQILPPNKDINLEIFTEQQNLMKEADIRYEISQFHTKPLISVVMPVYNVEPKWLYKVLDSIINQYYENWELCAADDCSTDNRVREILKEYSKNDSRIISIFLKENKGISVASNASLHQSHGTYITLIDNDDEITKDAFFWMVKKINEHPESDFLYSDECKIDENGRLFEFVFKPDWSPEALGRFMYTGHLTMYRTELVKNMGGFRSRFDTGQDFDLALRISEAAKSVQHIEKVLYLWRAIEGSVAKGGKPKNIYAGADAVADMMKRRKINGIVLCRPFNYHHRLIMDNCPKVSLIIPSDDGVRLIHMLGNILQITAYTNYEIIVVCNSNVADQVKAEFYYVSNLNISLYDQPYNFSDKCNQGVKDATSSLLVFLQDKLVFFQHEWLNELVEMMMESDLVGGVSPMVIRGDSTIQYAGIVTGTVDLAAIPYNGYPKDYFDNYWSRYYWVREVSVLSGTCMAVKRSVFEKVGGFDAINTPDKFSNLDISFKILQEGFYCLYNSHCEVVNAKGDWWDSWFNNTNAKNSHAYILRTWGKYLMRDSYFTDSMKRAMMSELPWDYKIYSSNKVRPVKEKILNHNILFISHSFSLTGAPIVLLETAKVLADIGCFSVMMCHEDGNLRKEIVKEDIAAVVDPWMFNPGLFLNFAKSFDLVFVNSACSHRTIQLLNDTSIPVIWWIHESKASYTDEFISCLPKKLGHNINTYCGGEYARQTLLSYREYKNVETMFYYIEDKQPLNTKQEDSQIVFSVIGSLEYRKGQDIFVKAIELMPQDIREKCKFYIIGSEYDHFMPSIVYQCQKKYRGEVIVIDELSREELVKIYEKSTAIISTSRDDPMPVVMTEAMRYGKVCVCSNITGTASLIEDNVNGFVFKSEDAKDLLAKMIYIFKNKDALNNIGKASRETYEKYFSREIFKSNVLSAIDKVI